MTPKSTVRNAPFRKRLFVPVIVLILSLLLAACGMRAKQETGAVPVSSSVSFSETAAQSKPEMPASGEPGLGGVNTSDDVMAQVTSSELMSQRKLIMDGDVSIETLKFDESVAALDQLVNDLGGFIEVRNVRGKSSRTYYSLRTANFVIRIPAENFDLAMKNMSTVGNVLDSTSKGTDITDTYYDIQTRIKTLKVQEDTLLEILSRAGKLDDVITLQSRISEVRYEIESLENTIRNYDRLVAYSRITVFIQEVDDETQTRPKPKTLGERISESFGDSIEGFIDGCEDFLVWLARSWITLIFIAIVIIIAVRIIRSKKFRKKKAMEKTEAPEPDKKE